MRDPLDTLRNLRDVGEPMRASDLARFEVRRIEDVQADLDKLRHDGLVEHERDPMGSEWWTLSEAGADELARVEQAIGVQAPNAVLDDPRAQILPWPKDAA